MTDAYRTHLHELSETAKGWIIFDRDTEET
jgi:hypothetical protein